MVEPSLDLAAIAPDERGDAFGEGLQIEIEIDIARIAGASAFPGRAATRRVEPRRDHVEPRRDRGGPSGWSRPRLPMTIGWRMVRVA
jgi:hypothetical protein